MQRRHVKHLAIIISQKFYRVLVETWDGAGTDISKLFPAMTLASNCTFIYNLSDDVILKNRLAEDVVVNADTVHMFFDHLSLLTMSQFESALNIR